MRRLIIILIFLVASVWFGLEVLRHPGYLLIAYQPWMIQMPLWFALLSALIVFGLFYLLINGLDHLSFLWYRLKNWAKLRREHKSYSQTQNGLSSLIEGRWKKAESLLLGGIKQSIEPLMNYLGAAKAAHEQKAFDRSDSYIKKAYEVAPKQELAIGLTQAELEISHEQFEHAAATLNHLRELSPRHPRVLKLLEKVYVHLADWKSLQDLLPGLRKARLLTAEQTELFEKNIYCEELRRTKKNLVVLHQAWNGIPRHIKKNPDVVCAYVQQLMACHFSLVSDTDTSKEVEELIRKTLKYSWQPELARIYGMLPLSHLNRQLAIVGAWVKLYGQKPELLLTLGKICARVQLWGKAKDYFEKCLELGANADASLEYGKLLEQLGEGQQAVAIYRDGLSKLSVEV